MKIEFDVLINPEDLNFFDISQLKEITIKKEKFREELMTKNIKLTKKIAHKYNSQNKPEFKKEFEAYLNNTDQKKHDKIIQVFKDKEKTAFFETNKFNKNIHNKKNPEPHTFNYNQVKPTHLSDDVTKK